MDLPAVSLQKRVVEALGELATEHRYRRLAVSSDRSKGRMRNLDYG